MKKVLSVIIYPFWYVWYVIYENLGLDKKHGFHYKFLPNGSIRCGLRYPAKRSTKRNCVASD